MNNFENVDLTYYGEDIFINNNKEYHAMQDKIKKYLQFIVDTILDNELQTKSIEANQFVLDLMDVIENISSVKNYDGSINKIIVSDKYIIFDYFKIVDDEKVFKKVIIDKETNDFNFIDDNLLTTYCFSSDGISKEVYEMSDSIYMLNDDTIKESIADIKDITISRKAV
ncbi:MAG: hypothetical protein J6G98_01170 [Bacilli bacterium]|nr:hypothetical protein [Bacilli bacterium]